MEQFPTEHFDAIVTLVVGLLGGGALIKYTSKRDTYESNEYKNINTYGGNFAGRDMHKNVK